MISRERCLEALEHAALHIADIASEHPASDVPRYPGTDVEDLVRHVITVHEWVTAIVDGGLQESPTRNPPDDALKGSALLDRFGTSWRGLVGALRAANTNAAVWTFGPDKTVAFWLRRMAHETAIHSWDADSAVSPHPTPIPLDLAVTGLGEGLEIHCARPLRKVEVGGSGETVGLTCTDADADWTITLQPVGIAVSDGVGHPDARLAGTASDLWLAVGGRDTAQPVARFGDEETLSLLETALRGIRPAM